MTLRFRYCLLGLVLAASPAAAGRHVPTPASAVRLLAPAPGARLVAGGPVEIAWEPGADFAIVEGRCELEEWELFLSYDGGLSWPVRLTPHLDAERRRFETALPEIASDTVRFMMRMGNERIESEIEFVGLWRIEPSRFVRGSGMHSLAGVRFRGESARAAGAGTVAWLEGTRGGRDLRWRTHDSGLPSARNATWSGAIALSPFAIPQRSPAIVAAAAFSGPPLEPTTIPTAFGDDSIFVASIEPLRRACRRNE